MEPMDLDDKVEHRHPPNTTFHASSPRETYASCCNSLPNFSPFATPDRARPKVAQRRMEQNRSRTFSSPAVELTPQPQGSPFKSGTKTRPLLRSFAFDAPSFDGSFQGPLPGQFSRGTTPVKQNLQHSFSRGATPMPAETFSDSFYRSGTPVNENYSTTFSRGATPMKDLFSNSFSRGATATPARENYATPSGDNYAARQLGFKSPVPSDSVGSVSMETSDRSDVSEMDVSQTSPTVSPSWEKVRSALSNFSLFKVNDTATNDIHGNHHRQKEEESRSRHQDRGSSSWEPGLTAVQAVTTLRRSGRSKQNSPSKEKDSPSKLKGSPSKSSGRASSKASSNTTVSEMPSNSSLFTASGRGSISESATGEHSSNGSKSNSTRKIKNLVKPQPAWAQEEKSSSCGTFLKVFSILLIAFTVFAAIAIHSQDFAARSHFASMDAELLRNEMASKVFGQHIAMDVVPLAVERYLSSLRSVMETCDERDEPDFVDDDEVVENGGGDDDDENLGENVKNRKSISTNDDTSDNSISSDNSHRSNSINNQLSKTPSCHISPLVLSFHGWTGVGKNFVSDIMTGLFPSKTVTKFLVPYHFPHRHLDPVYKDKIHRWVLTNVTKNSVNFFVFDEMDKAMPGVVEGIRNAISTLADQNTHNSAVIFLLLSNSFGNGINQKTFQAMGSGRERQSLTMDDFSGLFDVENVDSEGDRWYKTLKQAGFVSATVPFLPLEKQHVVQCIRRDLVWKKLSTQSDVVSRVLNELSFTKLKGTKLEFSQTGCKRVSDKVNLVAFD